MIILMVLFLLAAILLILIVLVQRGRGGGLAGALGGMGGHSAFGTKTGDVFTKATAVIAAILLILAMLIGYLMHKGGAFSEPTKGPTEAPAEKTTVPGPEPEALPAPVDKGTGE